ATRQGGDIERRGSQFDECDREVHRSYHGFTGREEALAGREQEARARLEQIAGPSVQEAKQERQRRLEDEARGEAAALARDIKEEAKRSAEREAQKVVALAIQSIADEHTREP